MPQMAPLWWTWLFLMIILSFMMIQMIMYYIKDNQPKMIEIQTSKDKLLNWKW